MNYDESFLSIVKLFEEDFKKAFKSFRNKNKGEILKYIMSYYRRWYHSALIENTLLSPANLIYELNSQCGKSSCTYPLFSLTNGKKLEGIKFEIQTYSLDNHPIISDLKIFIESCVPDMDLTKANSLTSEHINSQLSKLSIFDPYYVEYLYMISVKMGLIKKTLSIHSNKAQVAMSEFKKVMKLPVKSILDKIINSTAEIFVDNVCEILPLNPNMFSKKYVLNLLKQPSCTDDVFSLLFSAVGIELDDFFEMEQDAIEDNADEFYNLVMSSTFFLGIVTDKFFYTPFGFYLKLITPEYLTPCNFHQDIAFTLDTLKNEGEIELSLYSPCSNYYLTALGAEYFGISRKAPSLSFKAPFEVVLPAILKEVENNSNAETLSEIAPSDESVAELIYEIKIKSLNDKAFWKNIEVYESYTLHSLYQIISYEFNLNALSDYRFFSDLTENPFTGYFSPFSNRKSKRADETTLSNLEIEEGHKFLLVLHNSFTSSFDDEEEMKVMKFQLELVSKKEKKAIMVYPRVSKESRAFKEQD